MARAGNAPKKQGKKSCQHIHSCYYNVYYYLILCSYHRWNLLF